MPSQRADRRARTEVAHVRASPPGPVPHLTAAAKSPCIREPLHKHPCRNTYLHVRRAARAGRTLGGRASCPPSAPTGAHAQELLTWMPSPPGPVPRLAAVAKSPRVREPLHKHPCRNTYLRGRRAARAPRTLGGRASCPPSAPTGAHAQELLTWMPSPPGPVPRLAAAAKSPCVREPLHKHPCRNTYLRVRRAARAGRTLGGRASCPPSAPTGAHAQELLT